MNKVTEKFDPFADRMRAEELPNIVIKTFRDYCIKLVEGQDGFIRRLTSGPLSSYLTPSTFQQSCEDRTGSSV